MNYEKTGKKVNKDTANNAKDYALRNVTTSTLLWHLVKRHRLLIVSVYAVIVSLYYFTPFIPDIILNSWR